MIKLLTNIFMQGPSPPPHPTALRVDFMLCLVSVIILCTSITWCFDFGLYACRTVLKKKNGGGGISELHLQILF